MKLLLDSANINEVSLIANTDAISGVTTNPSLMAKEDKGSYVAKLYELAEILNFSKSRKHFSVEVLSTDSNKICAEAFTLSNGLASFKDIDLYIKIPVTIKNLSVITYLEKEGIHVNATACMMPSQAKLAMDAGASIVSFFYNRMKDGGDHYPYKSIEEFSTLRYKKDMFDYQELTQKLPTRIICGSIRKPEDIKECWDHGADYVTASLKVINLLMEHPQTDKAISGFEEDIKKWLE